MNRSGFTLVETLIYVVLLALILGFALLSLFELRDGVGASRGRVDVASESDFVLQKISWVLAGATGVDDPGVGATSSRLSVQKYGFAQNPLTVSFDSGTVYLARGAGPDVPLTSGNVTVDSLVFTHGEEVIAAPEFVQITMIMSASSSQPSVRASTTINTTIYLRK